MPANNRHHVIDQQLCHWLLLSLDRSRGNELVMTQELIASMLGVRREDVTEGALRLQKAGLIRYARGRIGRRRSNSFEVSGVFGGAADLHELMKKARCGAATNFSENCSHTAARHESRSPLDGKRKLSVAAK
jgi:hypothetical protein